jgi:two-component system nitrogen regulation response regulator GlnG
MSTLLVVDDEPSIQVAFRRAFRDSGTEVVTAGTGAEGVELARQVRPDVVVLDVQLPDRSGLDVLRDLRAVDARCPIIFITGKSTTDTAITAMKLGAYEYLLKPLELPALRQVIAKAAEVSRLMRVPAVVADDQADDDRADVIIGRCPAMQEVYKAIGRVAAQEVTVLITGESGTGKELVARAIYHHSRRAGGPFLAVNCAALPETLLESELFGHEKGAFTGADRQRIGKFEQCAGGTIFLDEVAELSPLAQGKMLRLLQDMGFERLGGNETIRPDTRVLAATNQDLAARVRQGRFRQDLYYRLSGFTIPLPPLRQRGDDLPLMIQHYLLRYSREFGQEVPRVSPPALDLLLRHPWPGNIRELQNVLKQALLKSPGGVLTPESLPPLSPGGPGDAGAAASFSPDIPPGDDQDALAPAFSQFVEDRLRRGEGNLYDEALRRMERFLLTRVLQHTGGNQLQAAKILGITRGSLRHKLRELGISVGRQVNAGEE